MTRQIDRAALTRTIAVVNGKGGVGKTSVTANLAGLYAAAHYRVLVVDLDPQGNLGNDLGYLGAGLGDDGLGLHHAAATSAPLVPLEGVRPGLDVVPGGEQLHDLAAVLQSRRLTGRGGVESFAVSLAAVAASYDIVLIDCPPGSDVLQAAALHAARFVLVPTKTDDASRAGLREVARRFTLAREHNPTLALLGVVLFGVNTTARRITSAARDALARDLGGSAPVFDATIRHVEAAAVDARGRGQLVHELERDVNAGPKWYERLRNPSAHTTTTTLASSASSLAEDYQRLADQVLTALTDATTSHEVPA